VIIPHKIFLTLHAPIQAMKAAILSLLILAGALFAYEPMRFLAPLQQSVPDGSSLEIGAIGPGQTFIVKIDPFVTTGGINKIGGRWDQAVAYSLPQGWSARPSKLYQNPLQVEITAAQDAPDGDYEVLVKTIDEGDLEKIGTEMSAKLLVHVQRGVLSMKVEPTYAEAGAGQPARFSITLSNAGAADEVFEVGSRGVSGWAFKKSVYVPAHSSRTITYEVAGEEESQYTVTIFSQASSSSLIRAEQPIVLLVKSNLISDYKATSNGVLLFPFIMSPMYSLSGLLALFFG